MDCINLVGSVAGSNKEKYAGGVKKHIEGRE